MHACSSCISRVKATKATPRIIAVCEPIHSFTSGVMNDRSLTPFSSMKYTIAVHATPPKSPAFHRSRLR